MWNLKTLFLATAALATACDTDENNPNREPPASPANDVDYIDALVPHHADAMAMADEVISRGADPEVRTMAQRMKAAQAEEIDMLEAARDNLTGVREAQRIEDPHSPDDMAELEGVSGIELDRVFLQHMIPHHAGAVLTSHRALPNLEREDMRELAEMTIVAQTREMNEMLDMLERLDD